MAPTVLHVDLDAFYVSMELLRRPELRGLPVVVGWDGPRGVIATSSYEARKFGVRSAMPSARAKQLCPNLVFLPGDFSLYGPASKTFHAILRDFTPLVESAGADEAYMDVAGCEALFGDGEAIGRKIRERVRAEIGITASVGVSTNKLVSKVASDACKPDGILVVPAGAEAAFFAPRPIRDLPMVGPKTAAALAGLGVRTIGDLAQVPVPALVARFGNHGAELHERALGHFHGRVHSERMDAKSISRESTFATDIADEDRLRAILMGQCERVAADLHASGRVARTVTLKLRFPPFETVTRASTPPRPITSVPELFQHAAALFEKTWHEHGSRPVRLVGVGVTNIVEPAFQLAFGDTPEESGRLTEAVTAVRRKFGDRAIRRAAELQPRETAPVVDARLFGGYRPATPREGE